MNCRKVTELLIDFVDGSISAEMRAEVQRHMCGCVPCAIYLHTYSDTIRVTQALPDAPIPREFADRLLAALRAETCKDE